MNDLVQLKVAISPDDLSDFVAHSPLHAERFEAGNQWLVRWRLEWWGPHRRAYLRAAQAHLPEPAPST
ncbi:MAG: hypothetical protein ABI548_02325 [Polyangiaceae bacterium]